MDGKHVYDPELPGVRTLKKDIQSSDPDSDVGVVFTVPQASAPNTTPKPHTPLVQETSDQEQKQFNIATALGDTDIVEGTIITDKRHVRSPLSRIVSEAWNEWWGDTGSEFKSAFDALKPKEKPRVSPVEEREGVLREASHFTRQVPKDDYKMVVQKVKTLSHDAEAVTGKPYIIKSTPTEKAASLPTWSHTIQNEPSSAPQMKEEPPIVTETPIPVRENITVPKVQSEPVLQKATPRPALSGKMVPPTVSRGNSILNEPRSKLPPIVTRTKRAPSSFFKLHLDEPHVPVQEKIVPEEASTKPPLSSYAPTEIPTTYAEVPSEMISSQIEEHQYVPTLPDTLESPTPEQQPVPAPPQREVQPPEPILEVPKVEIAPLPAEALLPREVSEISDAVILIPEEITTDVHNTATSILDATHTSTSSFWNRIQSMEKMRVLTLVLIIVTGALLGTGTALVLGPTLFHKTPEPEVFVGVQEVPSFITTTSQIGFPLPETREKFLASLTEKTKSGETGVVQYYPTTGTGGVANIDEILNVFTTRAPGSFIRTLNETIVFGSVRTDTPAPFIIFETKNFDASFAGMLAWEPYISADLSPLFGPGVSVSRTPQTGTSTTDAHFVDALTSNRSIRILYDDAGKERILYAFINKNTIIITTSTEALGMVVSALR